jgi:hypothetical protein
MHAVWLAFAVGIGLGALLGSFIVLLLMRKRD